MIPINCANKYTGADIAYYHENEQVAFVDKG